MEIEYEEKAEAGIFRLRRRLMAVETPDLAREVRNRIDDEACSRLLCSLRDNVGEVFDISGFTSLFKVSRLKKRPWHRRAHPPCVVKVDGTLAPLSGDHGMALGVSEAAVYHSQTRRLNAGDGLFV